MAEPLPPAGSHHPPPAAGSSDNEPRIDGDGQEVNALRFLGAGGPPAPPPPSITPVSTGVSQPATNPPAPPQTPHQHPPQTQQQIPPATGGAPYDPYSDPSASAGYHHPMQIPPGPMSGPYGLPPSGANPMMGGPMMMMPGYNYGMYPSPYGFMPQYTPPMAPQPAQSQSQLVAMLNVLRVNNPKYYREWYKKYSAHKRNPDRVPFPQIPQMPGFGLPGGPGSSATLPSYGRSRKESSRSSVNGDASFRGDSFVDYPVPNTSSRAHHHPRSGRTSVNGDYKPDDDFEIDGAASGDISTNIAGHVASLSGLHSTFNQSYQGHDRPQTQSGRSSTIGEPYRLPQGDGYGADQQDGSMRYENYPSFQTVEQAREPSPVRRMTPMKFNTLNFFSHMIPLGCMLRIKNSGTVLELVKMKQFLGHLPEFKELEAFPGPLTPLSTHKNTVIQFCKRKIKEARVNVGQVDKENYILLWEFLMLMLRQNGMVVGSDIAELLLTAVQQQQQQLEEQKKAEVQVEEVEKVEGEGESSGEEDKSPVNVPVAPAPQDEKKLVEEFCEHLLYGHKKDALEFAMDNGLWGHALFFASKMDERSYGHVLARFANGIPLNSPLQTLYHIMCGKQPASVTSCGDVRAEGDEETRQFGDWKPHLAMLLSNSGYKPEVEHRAIITLGDTLQQRNHWFAAQFCYLMGHEEFSKDSRLGRLLGLSPQKKNSLEATQMTEVYEFARKLADPNFSLGVSFLQEKVQYSRLLVSYGLVEEALAYCEEITKTVRDSRNKADPAEIKKLCSETLNIAERICAIDETGTARTTWIEDLRRIMDGEMEQQSWDDVGRKGSVVSSNQETDVSYSSGALPPQGGEVPMYDPYGVSGPGSTVASNSVPPSLPSDVQMNQYTDGNMNTQQFEADVQQQQHQQQVPQDWQNSQMMNGGLHLSQPPQPSPPQQQQPVSYDPPQIPMMTHGYQQPDPYQNQPSIPDAGYSSGNYNDKQSAPTINNNHWYNPYDSQPQIGGGNYPKEPANSSPVKKKSVRFEDEHHHPQEGNNSGGVQVVRSRARVHDPIDLKSALKTSLVGNERKHNGLVNGGDIERCGLEEKPVNNLDNVEYKSTYPIDEPINPPSSVGRGPDLVSPTAHHPFPPRLLNGGTGTCVGNTYPVDKECCDVNRPCEDHGEMLDESNEDDEEDGEADDDDEEGGGVTHSHDLEGLENGECRQRHFYEKTDQQPGTQPTHAPKQDKKGDKKKDGKDGGNQQQEKGWFSGLFKGLSLKPKNQMILPDDKNPQIVWDPQQKRWINTAADGEDDSAPAGPPPKDSDLMGPKGGPPVSGMVPNGPQQPPMMMQPMGGPPQQNNTGYQQPPMQQSNGGYQPQPSQPTNFAPNPGQGSVGSGMGAAKEPQIPGMPPMNNSSVNKYKLQRGRGMKGYIDVFNPNANPNPAGSQNPPGVPMQPNHQQQGGPSLPVPNLFIPPSMPGDSGGDSGPVSFLTAPPVTDDVPGQENTLGQPQPPPMFNPSQYQGYPQGQ